MLALLIASAAGAGALWWLYNQYRHPGPLTEAVTVIVPNGASVRDIARLLAAAGVVSSPLVLRIGSRLDGIDDRLRSGEYAFPPRISPREVVAMLGLGGTVVRKITVSEGLTTDEVLAQVIATDGLVGGIDHKPAEGSLLPETYHVSYGDSRAELVGRMSKAMAVAVDEAWRQRQPGLPLKSPEEVVILASIIEKETSVPEERSRVAAVFINRLKRGMRLQADPTVAYAVTGGLGPLGRSLTRGDLALDSPYNTYLVEGLPPGPIANPGRDSLMAAVNPLDSDDLYFVADGSGGHAFAGSLEEHNRNVAKLRRLRKNAEDKKPSAAD